jgi:pimeloyl-ACP methyl ester carboxylesterase
MGPTGAVDRWLLITPSRQNGPDERPECQRLGLWPGDVSEYHPLPGAPAWFRAALAVDQTHLRVDVDGGAIHALASGREGDRGLVFVHGGGAHAHWWTHVAATFSPQFRVLALDLSGHGDSGHRPAYSLEQWTDEVMAVADSGKIDGPPVIIGHSMGGMVTIATAARHGDRVSGAIICDSPVTEPDPEIGAYRLREAFGRPRVYPSVDEAVAHFRTVPSQEHYLDYVIDHVARQSVRPVTGGFQWKFDRRVFAQFGAGIRGVALPYLSQVRCRLALLRSEHGLVTADLGRFMYDEMGRVTPVIEIPEAGHHAMLDEPLILLTALRTLLADWDHSVPYRRPPKDSAQST